MEKKSLGDFMEMFKGFMKNRYSLATLLATIATVVGVIVGIMMYSGAEGFVGDMLAYIWVFTMFAAYICGGLFKAIGLIFSFASKGLLIRPFGLGLGIAGVLLGCGIILFLFVPIIPVYKAAKEYGEPTDNN